MDNTKGPSYTYVQDMMQMQQGKYKDISERDMEAHMHKRAEGDEALATGQEQIKKWV